MKRECENCKNFEEKNNAAKKLREEIKDAGGFNFDIHDDELYLGHGTGNTHMLLKTAEVVNAHETAYIETNNNSQYAIKIRGITI